MTDERLAMFSRDFCLNLSDLTIEIIANLCSNAIFSLPDAPDDTDRIRMHVNTPIEIKRTQKIAFTDLTLLAYMCTYS